MPAKRASHKAKSDNVFGQLRGNRKVFRVDRYASVSTNDQQNIRLHARSAAGTPGEVARFSPRCEIDAYCLPRDRAQQ